MLSLFARRAAFSPYRLTAVCTPILPLSAPGLRYRGILDTGLHASTAQLLANPRRNASAKASSATNTKKASTRPATTGRKSSVKLTPKRKGSQGGSLQAKELQEQKKVEKAASLKAKLRAQAEKKKEAARKKRLAERLAEKEKKRKEKEKSMLIKPPPGHICAHSLFIMESKKVLQEGLAEWRNLPEERKQEYAVRAKELSEKRKVDFLAFVDSLDPKDIRRYNRTQRNKGERRLHPTKNTSPSTPFIRFFQEFRKRPEQMNKAVPEAGIAAGEAWRSLTQEEKHKYKATPSESTTN